MGFLDKYLVPCKNYGKKRFNGTTCGNKTHFYDGTTDMDSYREHLRRERLGLCVDCFKDLKSSPEYKKVCEAMGWKLQTSSGDEIND